MPTKPPPPLLHPPHPSARPTPPSPLLHTSLTTLFLLSPPSALPVTVLYDIYCQHVTAVRGNREENKSINELDEEDFCFFQRRSSSSIQAKGRKSLKEMTRRDFLPSLRLSPSLSPSIPPLSGPARPLIHGPRPSPCLNPGFVWELDCNNDHVS